MARNYGHKHLSNRDFLTAGATPEMQNAQANAKDNSAELASQALGSVNKQLYDFIAQALQTSLGNIMGSGTVEFEKLSQEVYRSVPEIIAGKMKDGDIADAMIDNLSIYNGEVKPTTSSGTTTKPKVVEKEETAEGKTTEVEGKTTEVQAKPIEVTQPPVEVEAVHETVIQEQTHIQPTKEIITQEKTIVERPEDEHPELPAGFFMDEKEMAELKTKLKLLFIYLRSQKVDIFKLMAGVDENLVHIKDKREEINLDYEEELRYRQNLRKEFNRQVALESEWYERAFGALEEDEDRKAQQPAQPQGQAVPEQETPASPPPSASKPPSTGTKKEGGAVEPKPSTIPEPELPEVEDLSEELKKKIKLEKSKKAKKPGLIQRALGRILSPLKPPKGEDLKKKFIFVVVPLGDGAEVRDKKGKRGVGWLFSKNPLEQKKKDEDRLPKKPPLRERVRTALLGQRQHMPKDEKVKLPDGVMPEKEELKAFSPVQKTKAVVRRFVRRRVIKTGAALRRTWRKVAGYAKRKWERFKKRVRVVGRMVGRKVKRFGQKVWRGAKRVSRRLWIRARKVGRRIKRAVIRVAGRVGKAMWNVGKKITAAAYNATAKATVAVTRGIGKGLTKAGQAAAKIPYVGPILGPILMGLGVGITAMSKALRVAFKAVGRAAKAAARVVEKAFAQFMKKLTKDQNKVKGATSHLAGLGEAFKKFGFKGFFTQLGRAIKSWTSKWIINGFAKRAMSGIDSIRKKGLNLKEPVLKLKSKWGNSKIKKESNAFLHNIYMSSVRAVKGALRTSFAWVSSIMHTMGEGMTKMLSTLGERIATVGTVGLKGFLKALFSPAFLIPIGIILLIVFRKHVFGWLKKLGNITFRGIFQSVKWVGDKMWRVVKTVGSFVGTIGGWLWRQSNPNKPWTIAWFMKWGYKLVVRFIIGVKKWFMDLVPKGKGRAFMLGMALGGYPWPLYGAMIYGAIKNVAIRFTNWIRRALRTYLGIIWCWMPNILFNKLIKLLGLADVSPIGVKQAPTLDDALRRHEDNESKVDKLTVNLSAANYINPVFKEVGLPDLNVFNKSVGSRLQSNKDIIEKYADFVKNAADVLTDRNKAPGISPTFYGSPQITEALLSVFFFRDPLTGQVVSVIPKQNIPGVVMQIQKVVLDAAAKNDAGALAQANTDVLAYFDYMNRGRSRIVANIAHKYENFIDRLASVEGVAQRKLAEDFTSKLQKGDFAATAIGDFALDMAVKTGEATATDMKQAQLSGTGETVRGSVRTKGATSLIKASSIGTPEPVKAAGVGKTGGGQSRIKDFLFTGNELKGARFAGGSDKMEAISAKREAWKKYTAERTALIKQGKSKDELIAAGYGMAFNEWSEQYDKQKRKELQGDLKKADKAADQAKGKLPVVKIEGPKIPKIVLPQVQFKRPAKQVKISLPGLTREVQEGTRPFDLYDIAIKQTSKEREFKIAAKKAAWKKYSSERTALIKQGKSGDELVRLGYGMAFNEWSAKYEAEQQEKEKAEEAKKGQTEQQQEAAEKQAEDRVQEVAQSTDAVKPPKQPGHFDKLITQINKLHTDLKFAFDGLTAASVLPDLAIVKGNGKLESLRGKKKETKKPFRNWLSALEAKAAKIKESIGLDKDKDIQAHVKIKSTADMMAPSPKEEDLAPKESAKEQENLYKSAGVSLVSEAQWVSAQDAHKLEERIISNAKSVRDIIEGLRVMGKNLDNAKLDLQATMEDIKKHPVGNLVTLPPTTVPAPLQINIPDQQPEYDPLPPL